KYIATLKSYIKPEGHDYIIFKEDYVEWKVYGWDNLKEGGILKSPNFRIGNSIW
ncbi:hypothetical protein PIROE2DRAFT_9631, partial [Piromyces sp. E2]